MYVHCIDIRTEAIKQTEEHNIKTPPVEASRLYIWRSLCGKFPQHHKEERGLPRHIEIMGSLHFLLLGTFLVTLLTAVVFHEVFGLILCNEENVRHLVLELHSVKVLR